MASSEVASNPRVPNDDSAASSTRARVSAAPIYQMVDNVPVARTGR